MKMLKTSLFCLGLTLLLTSCDPETTYRVHLDNQTNDTLTFVLNQPYYLFEVPDSFILLPMENRQIVEEIILGKDPEYECNGFPEDHRFSASSGDSLAKDITDVANWTHVYDESALTHDCTFQINPGDLQ